MISAVISAPFEPPFTWIGLEDYTNKTIDQIITEAMGGIKGMVMMSSNVSSRRHQRYHHEINRWMAWPHRWSS